MNWKVILYFIGEGDNMKKSFRAISIAICIAMAGSSTVFADELPDPQTKDAVLDETNDVQASEDNISAEDILAPVIQDESSEIKEEADTESTDVISSAEASKNEESTVEYQTVEEKGQLHQEVDDAGNKYMVYDDGSHYTGWYDMEPFGWLYFDSQNDGAAATGKYQIEEKTYIFDDNGINLRTSGTPLVDGNKYWIKEDGSLGSGWLYLGNWKMYFDPDTFCAKTASDKVVDIDGEKYLFNEDGVMQTFAGTTIVNGAKYWFSDEGVLKCGWLILGDWKLYFDTQTYEGATGLKEIDGTQYVFDSNGVLIEKSGTIMVNGNKYCVENGKLKTGWVTIGDWKLYFDPETGAAATKVTEIDGKNYIFDKNGVNITGSGTFLAGGNKYYIDSDGNAVTGWATIGDWKLYFDPETGAAATKLTEIDGKNYIFDKNGVNITGSGTFLADEKKYYIDSDGNAVTGWVTIGNWKLYFDPETGAAATKITEIDGKTYNFNSDGVCLGEYVESEALRLARKKLDEIGWSLRAAYNWSKSIQYTNFSYPNEIAAGVQHSEYYATYGFTHSAGNCYVMAATFLYMARVLGYEGNFIEGQVPYRAGGYGPHGWCELNINGTTYVFDPNFEHDTGRNGYQITYGASGTWKYVNWKVVA